VHVRLVTCDLALAEAAIAGDAALGRALGCAVAGGWAVFPDALGRVRDALAADPGGARWGTRLFLVDEPRTLVGWGGFKGAPRDGAVEVGYAVAPGWEGRGVATDALRALVREAWEDPAVRTVLAHTLAEPGPSVRVLEKAGFAHDGAVPDEDVGTAWRFRLQRPGG
jgi:RimJ/RimL family protein N-acetyltransferase